MWRAVREKVYDAKPWRVLLTKKIPSPYIHTKLAQRKHSHCLVVGCRLIFRWGAFARFKGNTLKGGCWRKHIYTLLIALAVERPFCAIMDWKCSSYFAIVSLSSLSKLLKTWMRKALLLAVTRWKLENGRVFLRRLYRLCSYTCP